MVLTTPFTITSHGLAIQQKLAVGDNRKGLDVKRKRPGYLQRAQVNPLFCGASCGAKIKWTKNMMTSLGVMVLRGALLIWDQLESKYKKM
jgi:hypothetical protein